MKQIMALTTLMSLTDLHLSEKICRATMRKATLMPMKPKMAKACVAENQSEIKEANKKNAFAVKC